MEVIGTIITGFRTLIGAIIPPLKKKYFDQPKIYPIFKHDTSSKSPRGVSPKNDFCVAHFPSDVIYYNDLTWEYVMILRNNSEFPAYNLKLVEPLPNNKFRIFPDIDRYKPILPNSEIAYKVKFYQSYEGRGDIANSMIEQLPEILQSGEFIIQYENSKGTKFYTVYQANNEEDKRYQFTRKIK